MDLNFEQLLAEHNQNYKEAEVFSSWMPPDGEYIASVIKLDKGTGKDDLLWLKLVGRIENVQDEKLNGKEFTLGFFSSKAFGILKGAVKDLSGEIVNDLGDAYIVLQESVGKVVRVKVSTTTSSKNGKDYTNCYIQEVINTETSTEATSDVPVDLAPAVEDAPANVPEEAPMPEAPPQEDTEGERQAIPEDDIPF